MRTLLGCTWVDIFPFINLCEHLVQVKKLGLSQSSLVFSIYGLYNKSNFNNSPRSVISSPMTNLSDQKCHKSQHMRIYHALIIKIQGHLM